MAEKLIEVGIEWKVIDLEASRIQQDCTPVSNVVDF
jgi:hypothetical protein